MGSIESICIVVNSAGGGGAEKAMSNLNVALANLKLEVSSIFINEFNAEESAPGIYLRRKFPPEFLNTLATFFKFARIIRNMRPDVILLNCDLPELFGAFIKFRESIVVVVEHSDRPWESRKILGRVVRLVLRFKGVKWVRVGEHFNCWTVPKGDETLIKNAVCAPTLNFESSNVRKETSINRLVFIGRLSSEKNPKFLLTLGHELNLPVLFIGSGKLENELVLVASQLNVDSQFMGFNENPWTSIKPGDLLVVPSLHEGDGLVAIESILANVPLLLSDIPSFRNFLLPEVNYFKNSLNKKD